MIDEPTLLLSDSSMITGIILFFNLLYAIGRLGESGDSARRRRRYYYGVTGTLILFSLSPFTASAVLVLLGNFDYAMYSAIAGYIMLVVFLVLFAGVLLSKTRQ